MVESIYIGNKASSISNSPNTRAYTRVILQKDGETVYTHGDESGKTLYIENPYATQEMCDNIYSMIAGYSYQPVSVKDAICNPAAEIGDAITTIGGYSGIYAQTITFGDIMTRNIESSDDEDTESEYQYEGKKQYVTYEGLLSGTTKVNGAGITPESIGSGAIGKGAVSGTLGHIAANTITTGETSLEINESLKAAETAILTIDAWVSGNGATFNFIDTGGIRTGYRTFLNERRLYIDGQSYVRAAPEGT